MKDKQICSLVRDLLPLYIEQLTSEETHQMLKEHLEECESCKAAFQLLQEENQANYGQPSEEGENTKEIDYLKKIRIKSRQRIWLGFGIALLVTFLLILVKLFVYGSPSENYTASVSVKNGEVSIKGEFWDSASVYSHYRIVEEKGEKRVVVYASLASIWNRHGTFIIQCKSNDFKKSGLMVNSRKVTKSGNVISAYTAEVFSKKHEYIGDMSKNSALADAIGIRREMGEYTNELQTKEDPYGWNFSFQRVLETSNEKLFNEKMRGYAYVLLASVDNVSEISWKYNVKTKEGKQEHLEKLTVIEAKEILGADVKSFGDREENLEELLGMIGLVMPGGEENNAILSF